MPFARVVLDTNVLVSALISEDGPPARLHRAWLDGGFELATSDAQIAEIAEVLARPKMERFIDAGSAAILAENLDTRAFVVDCPPMTGLSPDPKDDAILATAIAVGAELVISGDKKHMLALGEVEGIPIVDAGEALRRLGVA